MQLITFTKEEFHEHLNSNQIYYTLVNTKAGKLTVLSTKLGIFKAEFSDFDILNQYKYLKKIEIDKLLVYGTEFEINVWNTLIKLDKITTYKELANKINKPKSYRAVANALAKNRIAYFIPCHKVIRSDNKVGGYKWNIECKKLLLIS